MSLFLDSIQVFNARLKTMGLVSGAPDDALQKRFADLNWNTLGNFAFAISFSPGAPISEETFLKEIFTPLLANDAETSVKRTKIRRLYWEAYSAAAADMARRGNPEPPLEKATVMPTEERAFRMKNLKDRLGAGIDISADLEPGDCVIDRYSAMREAGVLRYVAWEDIIRWDQEIKCKKKDPYWKPGAQNQMVLHGQLLLPGADNSSDLNSSTC